jgi:hypothetical protein
MTRLSDAGLVGALCWAALRGRCQRLWTVLGWHYQLAPLQLLGPRIAVRECRAFRAELAGTDDIVGRLWAETQRYP